MNPRSSFVEKVRALEERLFAGHLDETDAMRMKNHGRYSWLYRPSHHIETGLITEDDVALLSKPNKRLLSIGAAPLYLERVLLELGIPAENIVVADRDPALKDIATPLSTILFDMTDEWPAMGLFDRIIFPESLCIAITDHIDRLKNAETMDRRERDALEIELLIRVMRQALEHLKPGGTIRANGPTSHPSVLQAMSTQLRGKGLGHRMDFRRFFLTIQKE